MDLAQIDLKADMNGFMAIRCLRLMRVIRLVRVFSVNRELKVFICSVIGALRAMIWMIVILVAVIFGIALFAMNMVIPDLYEGTQWADDMDAERRFGSLSKPMMTMLSVLLLGVWGDVVMPFYFVPLQFVMFFIAYTNITTFGVMNVVVAVATENALASSQQANDAELEECGRVRMRNIIMLADDLLPHNKDDLTFDELRAVQFARGVTLHDVYVIFEKTNVQITIFWEQIVPLAAMNVSKSV